MYIFLCNISHSVQVISTPMTKLYTTHTALGRSSTGIAVSVSAHGMDTWSHFSVLWDGRGFSVVWSYIICLNMDSRNPGPNWTRADSSWDTITFNVAITTVDQYI